LKIVGGIALAIGAVFLALLIIGSLTPQDTPAERQAKIEKACKEQFPYNDSDQAQCMISIDVKILAKDRADRQHAAERAAGQ
jgi:hypothetical protein